MIARRSHMYPALFAHACHPVLAGPVVGNALDLWGLENASRWSLVGRVRYRSRRDMIEIATDPAFRDAHEFKVTAMQQTVAIPVEPFLSLGSPRWLVAGVLTTLARPAAPASARAAERLSARRRRLAPHVIALMTSPRTRAARRWLAERRRRLRGEPHRVLYFHQPDDPYSQLAAELLPALCLRYDVALEPHLVGPPPDAAAPERARLAEFSRRDAADVAPGYGLEFPAGAQAPAPEQVLLAARILTAVAPAADRFAALAARVGAALWRGDGAALDALAREHGAADPAAAHAAQNAGSRRRERLGHYLGGMFFYAGEWYWGVDRLHHLERRLRALGLARGPDRMPWLAPRPDPSRDPAPAPSSRERLPLEFYVSLRSPYTAIVFDRVLDLARRLPVDLVLRPVLPMVMRGLPVPRPKQLYITLDTKREAEDARVAFGRICDPIGRPVERCFSLYPFARERGRAAELLRSFTQAAFAEGVDTGSDAGLRLVVERAGLDWSEALPRLDGEGWRDELEANRKQLFACGLWGVPCFRLLGRAGESDYSTWGQDRLWRVEQEIRRRIPRRSAMAATGAPELLVQPADRS